MHVIVHVSTLTKVNMEEDDWNTDLEDNLIEYWQESLHVSSNFQGLPPYFLDFAEHMLNTAQITAITGSDKSKMAAA